MFTLDAVINANAEWKAQKILIYGIQGLGKNTFAATFERPILARIEDGAGATDIATFPKLIEYFYEMEEIINVLHGEHNFKTLVIDTLDWMERFIWQKVISEKPETEKGYPVTDINDYGYGKGYEMATAWHRHIIGGLDSLRLNRGMDIVCLAHAEVKRHEPPDSEPYDRYQIKLHKAASALWQEWADMVLFCNYKTRIKKTDVGFGKDVSRGEGDGDRVIFTEERPPFKAKNRWSLPPEIHIGKDKTWSGFHKALHESTNGRYPMPEKIK